MRFENPEILYLLFALPLLGLFYLWAFRRRQRKLALFAGPSVVERLTASRSVVRQKAKASGVVVAVAFLIMALARPQWGYDTRDIERAGVDVFVAIDTSRSMLARDVPPDRLTRAKQILSSLIRRLKGDRVGIITYAGDAFVQCPLTLDYGMALNTLDVVDTDAVPAQGTAIGTAIRTATESFERSGRGRRVLILLTDGEDQGTEPLAAAEEAASKDIVIYTIGIGSREGNPIPQGGEFKRNKSGDVVNTRLDSETLQQIALKTKGKYIEGKPGGVLEAEEIFSTLSGMEKSMLEAKTRTIYHERFGWFLLIAALILAWEAVQNDRKRKIEPVGEKSI